MVFFLSNPRSSNPNGIQILICTLIVPKIPNEVKLFIQPNNNFKTTHVCFRVGSRQSVWRSWWNPLATVHYSSWHFSLSWANLAPNKCTPSVAREQCVDCIRPLWIKWLWLNELHLLPQNVWEGIHHIYLYSMDVDTLELNDGGDTMTSNTDVCQASYKAASWEAACIG